MTELLGKLNAINPLSPELQIHLKDIIKYKEYPKDSFLLKAPRICENISFSIQTLEDTSVYYITYKELYFIFKKFPEFNFVGRELLQHYYVLKELRSFSTFGKSADERYEYLLQFYADLIPRIPDKYLAAYLGMNPSTLSRSKSKYCKDQTTK